MGLKNGNVILENDYLNWCKMFNAEKQILEDMFGNIATEIEHIGSTSIKGLSAKPIIDIAVRVNDFNDIEKIKDELELIYTIKNNEESGEILLIKEKDNITYFLIHIRIIDSQRYRDVISFRDYLRNNYEDLRRYEKLKIELAEKYKDDRKMYTQSKKEFIEEILEKIKE